MYAMAGAKEGHNSIVWNATLEIGQHIRSRSCKGYSADMRVKVGDTLYAYPDVVVVCGEAQFLENRRDTLLNPTLIIEVLSPSTEAYDRGLKFELYRSVESIREYVLVSSERALVEKYTRQSTDQWLLTSANKLEETIHLQSIDFGLRLANLYEKVELAEAPVIPTRLHP
jgi:Uma2 family endonuclease